MNTNTYYNDGKWQPAMAWLSSMAQSGIWRIPLDEWPPVIRRTDGTLVVLDQVDGTPIQQCPVGDWLMITSDGLIAGRFDHERGFVANAVTEPTEMPDPFLAVGPDVAAQQMATFAEGIRDMAAPYIEFPEERTARPIRDAPLDHVHDAACTTGDLYCPDASELDKLKQAVRALFDVIGEDSFCDCEACRQEQPAREAAIAAVRALVVDHG